MAGKDQLFPVELVVVVGGGLGAVALVRIGWGNDFLTITHLFPPLGGGLCIIINVILDHKRPTFALSSSSIQHPALLLDFNPS